MTSPFNPAADDTAGIAAARLVKYHQITSWVLIVAMLASLRGCDEHSSAAEAIGFSVVETYCLITEPPYRWAGYNFYPLEK